MSTQTQDSRRRFLISAVTASSGALLLSAPLFAKTSEKKSETEVGPAEDLMREHGALNRVLLIYDEGLRRLRSKQSFELSVLNKSAQLIRSFIEDYHEKLEEEFVFPRMRKQKNLVELVNTLESQHKAGRTLTAAIEKLATSNSLTRETDKQKLISSLESFIRMYRPHESREDTVLFPAFHESLSEKDYDGLGEKFEEREHKLFGAAGFQGIVSQIEALEKEIGIFDLSQFTPNL